MATIQEKLEALFDKVRALPEERQKLAVLALSEITEQAGVYMLSDEERAILEPALREAEAGEGLSDAETDELLTKPWR
jgi:hypothetical protein